MATLPLPSAWEASERTKVSEAEAAPPPPPLRARLVPCTIESLMVAAMLPWGGLETVRASSTTP
jgi:hypothetical protein